MTPYTTWLMTITEGKDGQKSPHMSTKSNALSKSTKSHHNSALSTSLTKTPSPHIDLSGVTEVHLHTKGSGMLMRYMKNTTEYVEIDPVKDVVKPRIPPEEYNRLIAELVSLRQTQH